MRSRSTENLSDEQKAKRLECLNFLHEYKLNGVFPKNTFHKEPTPYFIDIFGTACAVGQLIIKSGYESFAKQVSVENNYAYIKELNKLYPGLQTWADVHGFTLSELAWIQPAYQTPICDTGCVYTAIITPNTGQGPYTYLWTNGETSSTISNMCPGNQYQCSVIDAIGDTIDPYDCQIVFGMGMFLGNTVYIPAATPFYYLVASTNDEGNCNGTASVDITMGTPPFNYYWQTGGETTRSIQGLCQGTYLVTAYDSNGCYRYDSVQVLMSVGIDEPDANAFEFYPNPAQDKVVVELENEFNGNANFMIKNILGEIVMNRNLSNKKSEIDIGNLKDGVYFLIVGSENNFIRKTLVKGGG
ncbi:MAG: T9SS type A sorting domain-containing protein [Bacteroidia bacterium]|nr:T9SS type A sorting domain-containing protein [Bacteroidia bacterium]